MPKQLENYEKDLFALELGGGFVAGNIGVTPELGRGSRVAG